MRLSLQHTLSPREKVSTLWLPLWSKWLCIVVAVRRSQSTNMCSSLNLYMRTHGKPHVGKSVGLTTDTTSCSSSSRCSPCSVASRSRLPYLVHLPPSNSSAVAAIIRKLGVSERAFDRWKKKYAGLTVAELRRIDVLPDTWLLMYHLVATTCRCQRMIVSGVTIWAPSLSRFQPSVSAFTASRRLSSNCGVHSGSHSTSISVH